MFWSVPSEAQLLLEEEIARGLRELKLHEASSDEYQKRLDRVVMLYRMKEEEKSNSGASKDTLAVVFGNLMGIFMIVKHEHVNVITSRAMQFLLSPRWPKIG